MPMNHALAHLDAPNASEVEAHEWQRAAASLELARATRQPLRLCEALAQRARCERHSGQPAAAAASFDEALGWARLLASVDLLADLLCERGELAANSALSVDAATPEADPDAWLLARHCAAAAAGLAARTSDPAWEVKVLLRASDLFNRLGSSVEATALQVRAMRRLSQGPVCDTSPPPAIQAVAHPTLQ